MDQCHQAKVYYIRRYKLCRRHSW